MSRLGILVTVICVLTGTAAGQQASGLDAIGAFRMPHAHSVAVDPRTHFVYFPLENIEGQPLLRVMAPGR